MSSAYGSQIRVYEVQGYESRAGRLNHDFHYMSDNAVRPVLSLKSCVAWKSGDGTVSSPYEVEIDDTCAAADN